MSDGNLTAVLYKVNDLRLEERPINEPKENEVLLKMGCVGICGSDVHYLTRGRIGDFVVRKPMVMGHEASGTVIKVGSKVTALKPGDRVAVEPGVPCRECEWCKGGSYNLCPDITFCATPPVDGNLSRYYTHPADFCHKLKETMSLEEGALLEPLSVAVHACSRAELGLSSSVLVLGAGPVGLLTVITARAMGASRILVTDLVEQRLEVAKKCGADSTVLLEPDSKEEESATKIRELLGQLPDKTIDCCGFQASAGLGLEVTKPGGTYVLVGMGDELMKLPLLKAAVREIDIRGVFRYANDYPAALKMVASGRVDLSPLVTHRFNLEESHRAFQVAQEGIGNPIKVMIYCNEKI